MKLVLIESPYAGDIARNVAYAKAAVRDCLARGEAPYASHLFFTQEGLLRDDVPEERKQGIEAGLAWGAKADLTAVYMDHGITEGMKLGIERARVEGRPVEERSIIESPFASSPAGRVAWSRLVQTVRKQRIVQGIPTSLMKKGER